MGPIAMGLNENKEYPMKAPLLLLLSLLSASAVYAEDYKLSLVETDAYGMEGAGLKNRSRCDITEQNLSLLTIVDENPVVRKFPISLTEPTFPRAVSHIAELVAAVSGAVVPEFKKAPAKNYWVSGPDENKRKLLKSIQAGVVVAEDKSSAAQSLIRYLDKNCR